MLRQFTVRLSRSNNKSVPGERANVAARRTSTRRRVSARKSTHGGLGRGTSVRRSHSGVRRGASVRRAPSNTAQRTSTRIEGTSPAASPAVVSSESSDATVTRDLSSVTPDREAPSTTQTARKSLFSKLASRLRGAPKPQKSRFESQTASTNPSAIAATFFATNLSPIGCGLPSLNSPPQASRVTFVDTIVDPTKITEGASSAPGQQAESDRHATPTSEKMIDEHDDAWVDVEDDTSVESQSRKSASNPDPATHTDTVKPSLLTGHASTNGHPISPAEPSVDVLEPTLDRIITDSAETSQLSAVVLSTAVDEKLELSPEKTPEATNSSKGEPKRRPPRIVVPTPNSTPSSSSVFQIPLSVSPLDPSPIPLEADPFRAEPRVSAETVSPASLRPSICLTPAVEQSKFDLPPTLIPLPPSPTSATAEPSTPTAPTMTRNNSASTSGGRSLSTTPSTRGPATPTSTRVPGHPAFAHFCFGGQKSPSVKTEDWDESEEERRGRSLEVKGDKRRMRSVSPQLDAVLEADETKRSSKVSVEVVKQSLPSVEETTTFGRKRSDDKSTRSDTDSEHEDGAGFFAFAEQQMEKDRKAREAEAVPKRSKTMSSFLGVGFGKRKATVEPVPPVPPVMTRSATSSLLNPPRSGPKRSSTMAASRPALGSRSTTEPRMALSPTMYTVGDIHAETGKIEDDESRRLSEAVFMF